MNILQVVSRLDGDQPARDVIESARFLVLNGHKAVIVSQQSARVKEIDSLGARHYTANLKGNIFLVPGLLSRLSRIIVKENIDVVHARDPLSAFLSFLASRRTGRALACSLYNESMEGFLAKTQLWAKRVIVSSENQARLISQKGLVRDGKICVVPPFVDSDRQPVLKPYGLRNFFVVGSLVPLSSPEKTEKLVKTISILHRTIGRLKVFVINTGPAAKKSDTEKFNLLVKRYLFGDIVTILAKETPRAPFDVLLELEEKESASAKFLLEAQSRNVPVVAFDAAWLGNYAVAGESLMTVNTNDPKALADKIFSLYKDGKKRSAMPQEAQEFVKSKFGVKESCKLLLGVYGGIIPAENILIIKLGALGDAILAVPSVRAIRERFKGAKIKLLVGIESEGVFNNCPYIDEIIPCDFKKRDKGLKGLSRMGRRLRREDFDIVVDFQNNKISHLLAFLSCAPERYGYDNGKLSFLLNRKIKDTGIPTAPVSHQERVLNLLDIHNIDRKLALWPSGEDEAWADEFLKSNWINPALSASEKFSGARTSGVKRDARLVAFNIGSSPRWVTKLWPTEYFVKVGNRLAGESGTRVILTGKETGGPRIEGFLENAKFKPINATGKTSITKLASLLKRCDALISSDSAPVHVAASVGTPFLALFGPTDPKRHLPPADNFRVFKKGLNCSPCYKTYCNKDYACMNAIKPDEVYEAVVELLGIRSKKIPNYKSQIPNKSQ